jgi:hypothetical protein
MKMRVEIIDRVDEKTTVKVIEAPVERYLGLITSVPSVIVETDDEEVGF